MTALRISSMQLGNCHQGDIKRHQSRDFISNLPDEIADNILERLPIKMAATTSILSKQWRRNWLSLKRLNFDFRFFKDHIDANGFSYWSKSSSVITGILLYHIGPINDFTLETPLEANEDCTKLLSQWMSFLSKNAVSRISITSCFLKAIHISSYIFWCSELVQLQLYRIILNPPPTGFTGFPKLQGLKLCHVKFTQQDIFYNLVVKCHMLVRLRLENWSGMDHIVIDVPNLETLALQGLFESLTFKDVRNLTCLSVYLTGKPVPMKAFDALNLASSCQLRRILLNGPSFKLLTAGAFSNSPPVAFNHVQKLCLTSLDLGDSCVLRQVFGMVESCPFVKKLRISVITSKNTTNHNFDCNNNHKLDHLLEAEIWGITGTSAELQFVEYLLGISSGLVKLLFRFGQLDTESQTKLLKALMGFPRASTKARLLCL